MQKLSLQLCFVLQYVFRPQRVALVSGILIFLAAGTAETCAILKRKSHAVLRKQVTLPALSE